MPILEPDPSPDPRPLRVLLVDDTPEALRALETILTLRGFRVTSVADGASALEVLDQPPPPDVVLVDMLLPDMDGLEVARRTVGLVPRPYVALVTGWSFEGDIRDVENCGVDRLFYKPLNMDELMAQIGQLRAAGRFG